jgi:hypothetical protein
MRHVVRMVVAIRFALSTRRDRLLEILALRHQLHVLVRSNRRFRPSDRALAGVATVVASVERRTGAGPAGYGRPLASRGVPSMLVPPLATCWQTTHRFRMSRLDSALGRRKLSLGRSRIHGELRKLGIVVSERKVSRYLPHRLRAPSQTWRTFLANHLGQFTFISPETFGDDVVDGSGLTFRQTPLSCDAQYTAHQCAVGERPSLQRTLPGKRIVQDHLHDRISIRTSSGRGPPTHGLCRPTHVYARRVDWCSCTGSRRRTTMPND